MRLWMMGMSWLTEHFWCDLICLVCTWWTRAAAGEKVWFLLNYMNARALGFPQVWPYKILKNRDIYCY